MAEPIVAPCSPCKPHEFQDKEYNGKRLKNSCREGGYRCTVCGVKSAAKGGKDTKK
jgi:CRISPR/Cas system-associated protein Cas10 (large subunit of type III CRISPR-Cas system)